MIKQIKQENKLFNYNRKLYKSFIMILITQKHSNYNYEILKALICKIEYIC